MPVNQNRNSIRVLRTTGAGYLAHKNIPNFSVGGGKDFTIQLWVVKSNSLDGFLYGQEGGFSLRLVGGRVVFSVPGCVTLAVEDEWLLPANRHDYIALRSSQGKYTLFINGIPAAEQTVTAKAAACTGDYYIGKAFTGGFSLVRVSGTARSDQDILTDNAVPPKVDEHCVFQSDCSTAQYKDVSANRLPIWASGVGAGCGIYTACTAFSGNGMISCGPIKALPAAHTLLLKIWPSNADRRQQVYAAMEGDKTIYAVELLPQDNGTFKLAVTNGGGTQAVSGKTLLPQLWQDVAAVFDGGKLTLYLDGAREGVYDLPISGSRSTVLVGSEYETGKPYYEKGFSGYVAYTAEFGRVLPADEIALYADDPPFMFEKGLVSLLPLDWPDEVESIGATPLQVTGSAPFTMAEGTTPQDGSVGVSVRLPTEVPPEWEQLSEDEKWAFQLFDELMLDTVSKLRGFPMEGSVEDIAFPRGSLFQYIKFHARKFYTQLIEDPLMSEAEIRELQRQLFNLAGKLTLAYERIVGAVTAGVAGAYAFCKGMVGAIICSPVGVTAVAVLIAAIIIAQKERKKKEGELEIIGISWNHQGNPELGGIHYHMGGPNSPETMIDKPDPKKEKMETRCVLVPSILKNLSVDVTIKLSAKAEQEKSGTFKLIDRSEGHVLGDGSANYKLSPGSQCTVNIPLKEQKLPKDVAYLFTCTVQFWDGSNFLTNCDCTLYLLPKMPVAPWDSEKGTNYKTSSKAYLRLEFADLFMPRDLKKRDFAAWAVEKLNKSGFVYDENGGGCHYCEYGYWLLRLDKFVRDLGNLPKAKDKPILNCADCAHIVSTACAMVGDKLPMTEFIGYNQESQFFPCNQIVVIGRNEWKHPFEEKGGGGFSYHMFNMRPQDGKTPLIFDACLKVDGGKYPGKDKTSGVAKSERLPTGMPACETTDSKVNVPTDSAYDKDFYRERLVCTDSICDFFPGFNQLVRGFSSVTTTAKLIPDANILQVMKSFSLSPTPEEQKALEARPKSAWRLRNIPGLTVEQETERHDFGRLAEPACQIEHWSFDTAEEAAMQLATVVASYATPDKCLGQQAEVDVGDHCVVVAGHDIMFCRRGHVFSVEADLLSDAISTAQTLDESVNV